MKVVKILFCLLILSFNSICIAQINNKPVNDSLIVDEFIVDLDKDGVKDKIIVYKNLKEDSDFEKEHFQLPIKIFKGFSTGFKLWYDNKSLLLNNQKTCVSEGYSNIVVKNKFFTIESQPCYDYNILVSIYMTFKIQRDRIYLYKYTEEYFDKSSHKRKIPSKTLSIKDFGRLEFKTVSIDLIRKKYFKN